ncbi:hypothetical protein FKW77_008495 [Venturia effusa]|uniref:Uncharacterized protein n=1 Tax=Venturia effusa TaxID=50376 RepID=A0A517LHR6_9PEZI|nr:hypothetical protein FKW77_008495 [Venturia effusa]
MKGLTLILFAACNSVVAQRIPLPPAPTWIRNPPPIMVVGGVGGGEAPGVVMAEVGPAYGRGNVKMGVMGGMGGMGVAGGGAGRGMAGFPGFMGRRLMRRAKEQGKRQINPGILRPRTLGEKR